IAAPSGNRLCVCTPNAALSTRSEAMTLMSFAGIPCAVRARTASAPACSFSKSAVITLLMGSLLSEPVAEAAGAREESGTGRAGRLAQHPVPRSGPGAAPHQTHHERDEEDHQEEEEQNLGDRGCAAGNSAEPQRCRDDRDDEENQRPIQ